MNTQPDALRLADALENWPDIRVDLKASASELRRLHAETTNQQDWLVEWRKCADEVERLQAVNAELLEALHRLLCAADAQAITLDERAAARAAIAKAEEK